MSKPIAAGQRNQLVRIEQPSTAKDSLGQSVGGWTTVCQWWCRARPLRGREFFAAGSTQSEATVAFSGNYRTDITGAMRVLWNGVPHAIVAPPIDVDGGRHTLELMCAAGALAGEVQTPVHNSLAFDQVDNSQYLAIVFED